MPRWIYLAAAGLLAIAILVALVHKPSKAEQATDLRGFLTDVNTDIESCAGGVSESLSALRQVESGKAPTAADRSDGISVAQQGASNCSPALNEQIDNLENYQVSQSLDSFGLTGVVNRLIDWAAPDAQRVQTDVANVLAAHTAAALGRAQAQLTKDLAALDKDRSAIYSVVGAAARTLGVHQTVLKLPS